MNRFLTRPADDLLRLLRVAPADQAVANLYARAIERLNLTAADCTAVRDLCRFSGYSDLTTHALLICMFIALQEGSACLPLAPDAMRARLEQFMEGDIDAHVQQIVAALALVKAAELGAIPETCAAAQKMQRSGLSPLAPVT